MSEDPVFLPVRRLAELVRSRAVSPIALAETFLDRLEKIGKKMGVSAAVESDAPVDFTGLFKEADKKLESNMENIEVKKTEGGGIAANLARLKKLKGGS